MQQSQRKNIERIHGLVARDYQRERERAYRFSRQSPLFFQLVTVIHAEQLEDHRNKTERTATESHSARRDNRAAAAVAASSRPPAVRHSPWWRGGSRSIRCGRERANLIARAAATEFLPLARFYLRARYKPARPTLVLSPLLLRAAGRPPPTAAPRTAVMSPPPIQVGLLLTPG